MGNMTILPPNAVTLKDGHTTTDSLIVAEVFGKEHSKVLKAIAALDCSEEFSQASFGLASYIDKQGKPRPMYAMSRDGFVFLVMGFTGSEAAKRKEAYIQRFNEMEAALHHAVPGEVGLSKDRYIELLEAENRLLKQPKPTRKKSVPVTNELICKIYDLLSQGLSGRAVADKLDISTGTVSFVRKLRPAIPLLQLS